LRVGSAKLNKEQQLAFSFQRISKIAVVLANDFVNFFLQSTKRAFDELVEKIRFFAKELFDPNYHHRETSLMRVNRELTGGT
ncbi:hypothetical protein WDW89_22105, partial [Deltaproteobacteria bacterium TL4]